MPPGLADRSVVVDSDPAGAIHETLRRLEPAVACLASHGRGRSAALIGSMATEVVARGDDPIVVGPMVSLHRGGNGVVVCVDDTPASRALIPIAVRWANLLAEPLVIMTVAEPVPPQYALARCAAASGPTEMSTPS